MTLPHDYRLFFIPSYFSPFLIAPLPLSTIAQSMLPLLLFLYALLPLSVHAAGQPTHVGTGPGTWEIVGLTGVSAQQLYLGNENKVYIIDKTQNNAATINGHPAWAVGQFQSACWSLGGHTLTSPTPPRVRPEYQPVSDNGRRD